jgi:hypothetical protein
MNGYSNTAKRATKAIFVLVSLAMILWWQNTLAQTMRSKDESTRTLAVEKVAVKDGAVSGDIHNLSQNTLRDVQLYMRYIWIWDNEFHPGNNDPSTSYVYTVPQEIPPGGRVSFTFSPSPALPKASGGHFMTQVSPAGYTEVIAPKR